MAKAKPKARRPLQDLRKSMKRMQAEGEKLINRLQRDGKTLLARTRTQLVKDVGKVRKDVGARAERTVRDLEKRVVKQFHAATAEQVGALERRVAQLETLAADLERRIGGAVGETAA
jgi:polyhydroxyalkanoate synthesis regulator phasin